MDNLGKGGQAFMLREAGAETLEELAARLARTVGDAGAIIDAALMVPEEVGGEVGGEVGSEVGGGPPPGQG